MGKAVNTIALKYNNTSYGIINFKESAKTQEINTTDSLTPAGTTEFSTGRTTYDFTFEMYLDANTKPIVTPSTGSLALQSGNVYWSGSAVMLNSDIDAPIDGVSKGSFAGKFSGTVTIATGSI